MVCEIIVCSSIKRTNVYYKICSKEEKEVHYKFIWRVLSFNNVSMCFLVDICVFYLFTQPLYYCNFANDVFKYTVHTLRMIESLLRKKKKLEIDGCGGLIFLNQIYIFLRSVICLCLYTFY